MKRSFIVMFLLIFYSNSWSWDAGNVHPLITDYAANYFFTPATLNLPVTLPGFINTTVFNTTKSALEWLDQGAKDEDNLPRPLNHFYAPTKSTIEAGKSLLSTGRNRLMDNQCS